LLTTDATVARYPAPVQAVEPTDRSSPNQR
jgi:hypothetical protein